VSPVRTLLAARLRASLADPVDLGARVLGDLLVAALGLVFLWALFQATDDLRGWRAPEVLVVWGLAEAANGLALAAFAGLSQQNQRYVLTGDLDRLLLRPVDPLLSLLAEQAAPGHLVLTVLGVALVLRSPAPLPPLAWLALPLVVLGGAALLGGLMLGVAAVGLRVPHRGQTVGLVHQAASFTRYPLRVFPDWMVLLLVTLVPMGLVAAVPGAAALGRLPLAAGLAPVGVGAAALVAGAWVWRRSLTAYASTGS
jgi:ABC-2 type transport system permease protein